MVEMELDSSGLCKSEASLTRFDIGYATGPKPVWLTWKNITLRGIQATRQESMQQNRYAQMGLWPLHVPAHPLTYKMVQVW